MIPLRMSAREARVGVYKERVTCPGLHVIACMYTEHHKYFTYRPLQVQQSFVYQGD